jgi:hypothetical protein
MSASGTVDSAASSGSTRQLVWASAPFGRDYATVMGWSLAAVILTYLAIIVPVFGVSALHSHPGRSCVRRPCCTVYIHAGIHGSTSGRGRARVRSDSIPGNGSVPVERGEARISATADVALHRPPLSPCAFGRHLPRATVRWPHSTPGRARGSPFRKDGRGSLAPAQAGEAARSSRVLGLNVLIGAKRARRPPEGRCEV